MKTLALALVFCAGWIQAADETTDRAAIQKTVQELRVFTADFDNDAELSRLRHPNREPTVVISKEPWGEATISIPGLQVITIKKIRFLAPDIAAVDAQASIPVLILLRKEGALWKIASLRILSDS